MLTIKFIEERLVVDVTEASYNDLLELAIHTLHIDDLKLLSEALDHYIKSNPQLIAEEQ
jgi:hypothetical protein